MADTNGRAMSKIKRKLESKAAKMNGGQNKAGAAEIADRTETRRVRVSYAGEGAGLALSLADSVDATDGMLRIADGCVTLEIPTVDGRPSMLAWDPAEVSLDDLGLAAAS